MYEKTKQKAAIKPQQKAIQRKIVRKPQTARTLAAGKPKGQYSTQPNTTGNKTAMDSPKRTMTKKVSKKGKAKQGGKTNPNPNAKKM